MTKEQIAKEQIALGLIVPSGGSEADYYGFEKRLEGRCKIYITVSRVGGAPGKDHDIDALYETGSVDWLIDAAVRLKGVSPDVYTWACTSGSFIGGRAFAEDQISALKKIAGCPVSSTSLAFVAALEHLRLRRVSILATYPEPVSRRFAAFLDEFDVEVLSLDCLGLHSGWDASKLKADDVFEPARNALHAEAQALLVPDTALPSLHFVEDMERRCGRPVLVANAVTLWDAVRLSGARLPCAGFGMLLAGRRSIGGAAA